MKTIRTVIGIISVLLGFLILFQSSAMMLGERVVSALTESEASTYGNVGFVFALLMIFAGIAGIVTRKERSGGFASGAIFLVAALVGFTKFDIFANGIGGIGELALLILFAIAQLLGGFFLLQIFLWAFALIPGLNILSGLALLFGIVFFIGSIQMGKLAPEGDY